MALSKNIVGKSSHLALHLGKNWHHSSINFSIFYQGVFSSRPISLMIFRQLMVAMFFSKPVSDGFQVEEVPEAADGEEGGRRPPSRATTRPEIRFQAAKEETRAKVFHGKASCLIFFSRNKINAVESLDIIFLDQRLLTSCWCRWFGFESCVPMWNLVLLEVGEAVENHFLFQWNVRNKMR